MRALVEWFKRWIVSTALSELHDEMAATGADPGAPPSLPLLEGPKKAKKK